MSLVKVGPKHQVVIPKDVRDKLGVRPGDYVEVAFSRNQAVIKRKKIVDDIPYTDEPLGPETAAGIREALQEIKEGQGIGPFKSAKDLIAHLHKEAGVSD